MSYKEDDGTSTTTIERPTTNILDLIDERVKENTEPAKTEIEREVERFDNSHKAENLQKAYDEIDRQAFVSTPKSTPKRNVETITNPFFGDPDSLNKMRKRYEDVVETPTTSPTLEIKSYETKSVAKQKNKMDGRMKLWLTTGVCCAVLLLALIICNIFSIGAINRDIDATQDGIFAQEKELQDLNGKITTETGTVPDGMKDLNGGTTIDITPTNPSSITTSDNVFNRISSFISYLFGR